jgi:hypothetical protein
MRIFFYAMLYGLVLMGLLIIIMVISNGPAASTLKSAENILLIIAATTGLICFMVAKKNYSNLTELAKDSLISLPEKLNQYRNALIRYLALCEMPALLAIISFFLAGIISFSSL